MTFVEQIIKAAEAAGQSATELLTHEFRQFAIECGWPYEVAALVSVGHFNGEFEISCDDDDWAVVLEHEQGTQKRGPMPAMTKFMNRLDQFADQYAERMVDQLWEDGVL